MGMTGGCASLGVEERERQKLELVGQRQQIAGDGDGGVGVDVGPERGVGGVFAGVGVVGDQLEGELVVADEKIGRDDNVGFDDSAVVGRLRNGQRREGGAVEDDLEVALRGDQARREVVVEVHRGLFHHFVLRDGEVEGVVGVGAVQIDGVGGAEVEEVGAGAEGSGGWRWRGALWVVVACCRRCGRGGRRCGLGAGVVAGRWLRWRGRWFGLCAWQSHAPASPSASRRTRLSAVTG